MFQAVPLPIIRSFPLYIRHWYMSCGSDDSFQARPAVIKPTWHILVPNEEWKTPDDGQRNCPEHVEFLDKNKFGKLMRLLVLLKRNLYTNCTYSCHSLDLSCGAIWKCNNRIVGVNLDYWHCTIRITDRLKYRWSILGCHLVTKYQKSN